MNATLEQLRQLSVADKLHIVEQLWDDIGESDEQLVLQPRHTEEASRRAAEMDANPAIGLTREELWQRVDESNG